MRTAAHLADVSCRAMLLLCALGGCIAPSPGPGGGLDDGRPEWATPREVLTVTNTQREAFLAVDPAGDVVLTCAHGDFTRPAWMFASLDGGVTFVEVGLAEDGPVVPGVAGDCDVALADDGTWAFLHTLVGGVMVATTQDQGVTWSVNPVTILPVFGGTDRPWMRYIGDTLVMVAQQAGPAPGAVPFARSHDHGASWTVTSAAAVPRATGPFVNVGPILYDDATSTIRVPVMQGNEPANLATMVGADLGAAGLAELGFAVSTDLGDTWNWQSVATGAFVMDHPTGVAQAGGVLHWTYIVLNDTSLDRPSTEYDHWWMRSDDGGATWSDPVLVGPFGAWDRPWGAGRPDGTYELLWQRRGDDGLADWQLTTLLPDGSVQAIDDLVPAYGRDFGEYGSIVHDAAGRAVIMIPDHDAAGTGTRFWALRLPPAEARAA